MLAVGCRVRLRPEALARWRALGVDACGTGRVVGIVWQRGWPAWVVVDWGEPLGLVSQITPGQLLVI